MATHNVTLPFLIGMHLTILLLFSFILTFSEGQSIPPPGSLPPPVGSVSQKSMTQLPRSLLPSTANLVCSDTGPMQIDPKQRPRCDELLEEIEKNGTKKSRSSPAFNAFTTLVGVLSGEVTDIDDDQDKTAVYCLDTLKRCTFGASSFDWHRLASLQNCNVDANGRTIYMKLVEKGFYRTLQTGGTSILCSLPVHEMIDLKGNNILHLAVATRNLKLVQFILDSLAEHTVVAMEKLNHDGLRPLDIALHNLTEDITNLLKGRYMTLTGAMKMAIRRRNASPIRSLSPSPTLQKKMSSLESTSSIAPPASMRKTVQLGSVRNSAVESTLSSLSSLPMQASFVPSTIPQDGSSSLSLSTRSLPVPHEMSVAHPPTRNSVIASHLPSSQYSQETLGAIDSNAVGIEQSDFSSFQAKDTREKETFPVEVPSAIEVEDVQTDHSLIEDTMKKVEILQSEEDKATSHSVRLCSEISTVFFALYFMMLYLLAYIVH